MARLLIPLLLTSISIIGIGWWASSLCRRRGWHAARRTPTGVYTCQEHDCTWRGASLEDAGFPGGWATDAASRNWEGQ